MEQNNTQKNVQIEAIKTIANPVSASVVIGKRSPNLPAWLVRPINDISPEKLSDNELYQKCREYGMNAKQWSRRFAGLLPEVAKRGLHRRKGFISIQQFAGQLAGMSEYAVDKILNLAKRLGDKPVLKKLFESGAEGWSKIETVVYVSTKETDKFWADKLLLLSKSALEVFVQNYRRKFTLGGDKDNTTLFSQEADPQVEPPVRFSFPASKEVEFDLRLAKQKFEKQSKQALSWNETFQMLIQKSELVSIKTNKFAGDGVVKKYPGLCTKCHKNVQIQSVQICDECMNVKMSW